MPFRRPGDRFSRTQSFLRGYPPTPKQSPGHHEISHTLHGETAGAVHRHDELLSCVHPQSRGGHETTLPGFVGYATPQGSQVVN